MPLELPAFPEELHECSTCGVVYAATTVGAAIETIREVPARTAAAVLALPADELRSRPDDTTWSIVEYVCHMRDVYAVYTIRLFRTRAEETPTLEPMLNDLRAVRFRYNQREVGPVVAEMTDNAAGLVDETERFADQAWQRTARRLPHEERTALWLLRQAAHEGVHHLHDIADVRDRLRAR